MKNTILLVEDEETLSRGISLKLTKEGYQVQVAGNIKKAWELFNQQQFALIICDIGLPDGSGLDFCRKVREKSQVLFLFLTALDTELDIVNGYDAGCDDYLTKPFSLLVLISKVGAMMRRSEAKEHAGNTYQSGAITLFMDQKRVLQNGVYVNLTPNEWKLLTQLMTNAGRILSKQQLLDNLWDLDGDFMDENTIAVNIRRLREKIEQNPSNPEYIKNIRGMGYVWDRACQKI